MRELLQNPVWQSIGTIAAIAIFVLGDSLWVRVGIVDFALLVLAYTYWPQITGRVTGLAARSAFGLGVAIGALLALLLGGSLLFLNRPSTPAGALSDANIVPLDELGPLIVFDYDGVRARSSGVSELQVPLAPDAAPIYRFKYTLPLTPTIYGFAGMAFTFLEGADNPSKIRDLSPYRGIVVRVSFEPSDAKCSLYIKDDADQSDGVPLNATVSEIGGEPVVGDGSLKTFRIPIATQLRTPDPRRIVEIGISASTDLTRGEGACVVHSIQLYR